MFAGVDCGELADPVNGGVTTDPSTRFQSVATYTCNVGYNLTGNETRNCQADAVWSREAPTCQSTEIDTHKHTHKNRIGIVLTYSKFCSLTFVQLSIVPH